MKKMYLKVFIVLVSMFSLANLAFRRFSGANKKIHYPGEQGTQNVLLVCPKLLDGFWGLRHILPFVGKKAAMPSLGLAIVSSLCPHAWRKRFVDMNIRELKDEEIAWADIIMVSAMVAQKESAEEVIRRARSMGKTVVVGGTYFTLQHEETPGVDHFVLGDAEDSFIRFLKDWEEGKPKYRYEQERWPDLSETPLPDWSLFNLKDYVCLPLQNSKGCPYRCKFCAQVELCGSKVRVKSGKQFAQEIEHAVTVGGWKGIVWIIDDNFIGNIIRVTKDTLPEMIKVQKKLGYPVKFMAEGDMRLASRPKTLRLMAEANVYKWFTGVETPVQDSLKETGKVQNQGVDMAKAMHTLMENGQMVYPGGVLGFDADAEREDISADHIAFYREAATPIVAFLLQQVYPQTELEKEMMEAGRLLETTNGDHGVQLTYVPAMEPVELLRGYVRVLDYLRSPKEYYSQIEGFLRHYNPTVKKRLGWRNLKDVRATVYVLTRIGMNPKTAPYFWPLIVKTLNEKPKALTEVIEYIIWGYHQAKVYDGFVEDAETLIKSGQMESHTFSINAEALA